MNQRHLNYVLKNPDPWPIAVAFSPSARALRPIALVLLAVACALRPIASEVSPDAVEDCPYSSWMWTGYRISWNLLLNYGHWWPYFHHPKWRGILCRISLCFYYVIQFPNYLTQVVVLPMIMYLCFAFHRLLFLPTSKIINTTEIIYYHL